MSSTPLRAPMQTSAIPPSINTLTRHLVGEDRERNTQTILKKALSLITFISLSLLL